MTNRDSIYVLRQPNRSFLSIILVRTDLGLPLKKEVHEAIDNLQGFSDVVFIFSDRYNHKDLDMECFSNLYGACAYICAESNEALTVPFIETVKYSYEIWEHHVAVLYTDTERLKDGYEIKGLEIQKLALSRVVGPIFKERRLTSEELGEIYLKKTEEKKTLFQKKPEISPVTQRYHSKWVTESKVIFFRISTLKNLNTVLWNKKSYINTFTEDNLGYFFASSLKEALLEHLDSNLEDVQTKG